MNKFPFKNLLFYLCQNYTMQELPPCPKCNSEYTYQNDALLTCPECFHEWNPNEIIHDNDGAVRVYDANGNELFDGDTVVTIKDLPVKNAPRPIRGGTKVKKIKLVDGDHNIDCKIDGFGAMSLKSIFVKKVVE
jgi:protein PhnA